MGRANLMSENPNPEPRTDQQPESVTPPQPVSEPTVPPIATPPAADPIDYKEKFSQSSAENQILLGRIKELEGNPRKELTTEPTDSDLAAAIPGWEYMDEGQKAVARIAYSGQRIARDLAAERDENRQKHQWNTDVDLFIAQNPSLQGKERDFRDFANKPSHRGAPLDVLKDAFAQRTATPTTPMNPNPQPQPSAPGLEPGNGGPREIEKPKQLDADQLKTLRETDERAYNEYVRTHDIDPDQL